MKIVILGSTGFVGRNIVECLSQRLTIIGASRSASESNEVHFDFFKEDSWRNLVDAAPDVIINAAAYGVVKTETEVDAMYKTNYFRTSDLYTYLRGHGCNPYWLQLGTAFEYDLSVSAIDENSPCLPRTHYGISKLMMTQHLLAKAETGRFCVLRPFGMFGKYEDATKFFPYLINAQKTRTAIDLSPGTQERDYIYVADLGDFIGKLIEGDKLTSLPPILNVGRGEAVSFRKYAATLEALLPSFDENLWRWGQVPFRQDESPLFYSASKKSLTLGFTNRPLADAFFETMSYYLSI